MIVKWMGWHAVVTVRVWHDWLPDLCVNSRSNNLFKKIEKYNILFLPISWITGTVYRIHNNRKYWIYYVLESDIERAVDEIIRMSTLQRVNYGWFKNKSLLPKILYRYNHIPDPRTIDYTKQSKHIIDFPNWHL